MYKVEILHADLDELSRCRESSYSADPGRVRDNESIQEDAALAYEVDQVLWKNEILRAMDYYEVDIQVTNRILHLSGYVASSTSNNRVEKAVSAIPGIQGVQNHLIMDDKLTIEVASALGSLEHTYNCKFFTGVSYGVVTLRGTVSDEKIKSLAEKSAASNPHVRGVINYIRVQGSVPEPQDATIYQPAIGAEVFFLNGVYGIVRQVIINPDNRQVISFILSGRFADQIQESRSMSNNEARSPERMILISVDFIRYLTKFSGFLTISSNERNKYKNFDPSLFIIPDVNWVPPYPYCPSDVLFPINEPSPDQLANNLPPASWLTFNMKDTFEEPMLANDSLGG